MSKVRYEEMRVTELAEARLRASLAYVPVGSLEYHGWHLPTGFDGLHAQALCEAAAQQTGGVVLPVTYWGTRGHEGFAGSLLIQEETLARLVTDVLDCLSEQGYRLIVLLTGHHPDVQGAVLRHVADLHNERRTDTHVVVLDPFNLHPTDKHLEHAGKIETSVMLHLRPELVDMAQLESLEALHAITPDCVEAEEDFGRRRLGETVTALVATVRGELAAHEGERR